MDEEQLRRVEDALAVYDRTHVNPAYPDGRDPISRDVGYLLAEVRRLRDEVRFYRNQAVAAQRRVERLEAGRERFR